jgi:hypothetical protein
MRGKGTEQSEQNNLGKNAKWIRNREAFSFLKEEAKTKEYFG